MKNSTLKRNGLKVVLLTMVFLFVGLNCKAQYSKSDMTRWFKNRGVEYLARYAHPNPSNNYLSYNLVSESSSCITVEIFYRGIVAGYSCRYDVYFSSAQGIPYFSNVVCTKEGCMWADCFQNWEYGNYSRYYTNYSSLYGPSSFYDLSSGKKAAFALTYEFLNR